MSVVAVTMVVGTLLVLTGLSFIHGMERNWLNAVAGTMVGDVSVTPAEAGKLTTFPTAEIIRAAGEASPAYVTERIELEGILTRGEASAPATVRGVDVSHEVRLVQTLRNREGDLLGLTAGERPIAVSQKMAVDLGAGVGDAVDLIGTRLNGERFRERFKVAYIFEGNVKNAALDLWVLLPLPEARRLIGAEAGEATSVRLFLKDQSPAVYDDTRQVLAGQAKGQQLQVRSWQETDEASWMTSVYVWKGILYFFVAVLSLLISIGAFGVISATILERTREVGTMRALGMTPLQVFLTLVTELFLVGLFSSALAIGLAYALLFAARGGLPATSEALILTFGGRRVYPTLSAGVLGVGLLFTTALAVVSGLAPIIRSAVMKEIEALRDA